MGLKFKGDAPVKKKKKVSRHRSFKDDDDEQVDGWLPLPLASLAMGPLYLTLPTTSISPPLCLALQPTTGKVYPYPLPTPASTSSNAAAASLTLGLDQDELDALVDLSSAEGEGDVSSSGPTDVHHVWVCTPIPDSEGKCTFRSATNRFLASDEIGTITADREARGMQEEWTIESPASSEGKAGVVRMRNAYGKLLSVDVVAGGKMELRADEAGEGGETEAWKVWMQGEYLGKAKKALQERMGIKSVSVGGGSARTRGGGDDGLTVVGNLADAEVQNIRKFQARGQGRLVGTEEDIKDLKRARKEGKLSEAMLERRVKLKSDRYC